MKNESKKMSLEKSQNVLDEKRKNSQLLPENTVVKSFYKASFLQEKFSATIIWSVSLSSPNKNGLSVLPNETGQDLAENLSKIFLLFRMTIGVGYAESKFSSSSRFWKPNFKTRGTSSNSRNSNTKKVEITLP